LVVQQLIHHNKIKYVINQKYMIQLIKYVKIYVILMFFVWKKNKEIKYVYKMYKLLDLNQIVKYN